MATQEQLDRLRQAINTGATLIRDGDKSTQYRSLSEMRDIEKSLSAELGVPSMFSPDNTDRWSLTTMRRY